MGIFTDGDLRRTFEKGITALEKPIAELMTNQGRTIEPDKLAVDALNMMQERSITVLPVVQAGCVVGIIHMHDLLKAGIA
jgi:arabinose-5-phosphate isomerase